MPLPSPDYLALFDILHNDVEEEVVPVTPTTVGFPGAGPSTVR